MGHLKMLLGEIAPATIIGWKPKIWWTEVCGSENNRWAPLQTPEDVINTSQLKAASTGTASIEQHGTESSTVLSIAGLVKVPKTTSALCNVKTEVKSPRKLLTPVELEKYGEKREKNYR